MVRIMRANITLHSLEFSGMHTLLILVVGEWTVIRADFLKKLVLEDVRTEDFRIKHSSFKIKKLSSLIKVAMISAAFCSKFLRLIQMNLIFTFCGLEVGHD